MAGPDTESVGARHKAPGPNSESAARGLIQTAPGPETDCEALQKKYHSLTIKHTCNVLQFCKLNMMQRRGPFRPAPLRGSRALARGSHQLQDPLEHQAFVSMVKNRAVWNPANRPSMALKSMGLAFASHGVCFSKHHHDLACKMLVACQVRINQHR